LIPNSVLGGACQTDGMKVNLDIPDPLYKRLRTQASVRGLRVKDFMVVFLEEGLDQLGDADLAEDGGPRGQGRPLPEILGDRGEGFVIPSLTNAQIEELEEA
jgi:hypothetical protein